MATIQEYANDMQAVIDAEGYKLEWVDDDCYLGNYFYLTGRGVEKTFETIEDALKFIYNREESEDE